MLVDGDSVLFVCMGNTCRSPMAEWLAKGKAKQKGLNVKFGSRGTAASGAGSYSSTSSMLEVTEDACTAVREVYPDSEIFAHEVRKLKMKDFLEYKLILTMSESQVTTILSAAEKYIPDLEERVFALREYVNEKDDLGKFEISDPMGGGTSSYTGGSYYQGTYYGGGGRFVAGGHISTPGSSGVVRGFAQDTVDTGKKSDTYTKCRDQLIKCLDALFDNPSPTLKDVIQRRQLEIQLKFEAEKEKTLGDYIIALERAEKIEERGTLHVPSWEVLDAVKNGKIPLGKDYVEPYVTKIAAIAQRKSLTVMQEPYVSPWTTTPSYTPELRPLPVVSASSGLTLPAPPSIPCASEQTDIVRFNPDAVVPASSAVNDPKMTRESQVIPPEACEAPGANGVYVAPPVAPSVPGQKDPPEWY